jgi:hypothetical protein
MILCGVPDSLGNLPVIDGSNATGQAGISTDGSAAGAGVISVWAGGYGRGTPYGYWQRGSAGPSYVTITGLHIVHGTPNYNYTPPNGGKLSAYGVFTACLNVRSGSYIDMGGNHLDTCGLGLFTDDNGNSGWVDITQLVTATGNHIQYAGISGDDHEHEAYVQSWYALLQGNLWENYNPAASGSAIKWRGVEGIFRYNNIASGAERLFDLVEEQDAANYVTFEGYLGGPGDTNCNDSMYCLGDKAGPNILAAYQESFQKDFIYGNELFGNSTLEQIHYLADSGSGMNDRNGTLYFFSNTLDEAQEIFDTGSNGDRFDGYFPQRIDARNNILWANHVPYKGAKIQMAFGTVSTIIMSATTNLMKTGTFTIQPPIEGATWQNNTDEGWSSVCDGVCRWPLSIPLNEHLYGLTEANYLTTESQPYDPTTMIPPAGSAAIDAGTALSGILQTMPVRWQYSIATNSLIPRLNPQTIGAVDFAAETAEPTFSPSGGEYTAAPKVSIESTTPSANIYYTTDGSTPTYPVTGTTQPYSGQITVAANETIQAIAVAPIHSNSNVGSSAYTINIPQTAMPTFTPASGKYVATQTVTISDATNGATIYYTTNGTNPGPGSTVYSGPITVSASETVRAIAVSSTTTQSAVASAAYTINTQATTALITWPTPAAIPYGTALGAAQLNATSAVAGSFSYSPASGILTAGSHTLTATFTPTDTVNYSTTTTSVTLTVSKATPAITWAAPAAIPYGTALGATQLDATSAVAGSFSYSPASGILTAGSQTLTATFTPTDTVDYSTTTTFVTLTVSKVTPAITWAAPAAIPYGTALGATQLDATSAVAGSFSYSPAAGILTAGSQTLTATFTPTDTTDYSTATASLTLTVSEATPTITWPAPAAIVYGTALGANQLDATSAVAGSFSYSPAAGILTAGSHTLTATFTPTDTTDYSTTTSSVTLTVNKATPAITWPTPAAIPFGTALSAPQLNATSTVAGSFSYSPAAGILTAGSQALTATFTPTDTTDYNTTTASVTLTVIKATPVITWATPAAIPYGTALSAVQLDAASTVAGSFTYLPAAGTVLAAGSQNLTTTFTPADAVDYSTATASVQLAVIPPPAFVQQCNEFVQFGSSASCTLSGVGAGHSLVIGIAGSGTQSGKVTTTAGAPVLAIKDGSLLSAYLLSNTSAGSITITFSATGNTRVYLTVAEYANTAALPLDGVASFVNTGYGNTISTPKFNTTTASDLLWSYCVAPGGYTLTPAKAPVIWTKRISPAGSGYVTLVEDGLTTSPGAYYGQCSGPGADWEIITVALKN